MYLNIKDNYKPVEVVVPPASSQIFDNCTAFIESVSDLGEVTIRFSSIMKPVNLTKLDKSIIDLYI